LSWLLAITFYSKSSCQYFMQQMKALILSFQPISMKRRKVIFSFDNIRFDDIKQRMLQLHNCSVTWRNDFAILYLDLEDLSIALDHHINIPLMSTMSIQLVWLQIEIVYQSLWSGWNFNGIETQYTRLNFQLPVLVHNYLIRPGPDII
jgi:hypothetical protein